jgi:hypothetical protein
MNRSILDGFKAEELELAQQLWELRRQPSPELARRVQAIPGRPDRLRPGLLGVGSRPALAVLAALLVVAGLFFASPAAQATLGQFEKIIGQIHLTILDVLPRRTNPIVVESTPVSLAEARAAVPFELTKPAYVPAGLAAEAQVYVIELESPIVKFLWRDAAGGFVQLSIHRAGDETSQIENVIGSESSDTILINGQEAAIIYGGWDETSRTWSHQDRLVTIIWVADGVQYNLLSYSTLISRAELRAMAESVQ